MKKNRSKIFMPFLEDTEYFIRTLKSYHDKARPIRKKLYLNGIKRLFFWGIK